MFSLSLNGEKHQHTWQYVCSLTWLCTYVTPSALNEGAMERRLTLSWHLATIQHEGNLEV